MTLTPGTRLGRYEIRSKLGEGGMGEVYLVHDTQLDREGGMGEVYLAEDTRLHRKVALKILPADLANHRDRMRRFEQEARAAAALNFQVGLPRRFQLDPRSKAADSGTWRHC